MVYGEYVVVDGDFWFVVFGVMIVVFLVVVGGG